MNDRGDAADTDPKLTPAWWVGLAPPRAAVIFAALVAISLVVRRIGADFGLPYNWHPDEPQIVNRAVHMAQTGSFDPEFFNYPTLVIYLHMLGTALWYVGLSSETTPLPLNAVQTAYDTGLYHTVGSASLWLHERMLTAALGSIGAGLTYLAGRKAFGELAGVLAGLFVAFGPQHTQLSRFVTVDVPASTAIAALLLACVYVYREGATRHYLYAGVALGLAVGSKYNMAVAAAMPLMAWFVTRQGRDDKLFVVFAMFGLTALTFAASVPYVLVDPDRVLRDMAGEVTHYMVLDLPDDLYNATPGFDHAIRIAKYYLIEGFPGWSLLVIVGALSAARSHTRLLLMLLAFPLVFLYQMTNSTIFFHRNLVAMTAPFALLAGFGAAATFQRLPSRALKVGFGVLLGLPAVWTLSTAVGLATEADSRVEITDWARAAGPDIVLGLPRETRISVETLGSIKTVPISLVTEGPEDWARKGATHVLGGRKLGAITPAVPFTTADLAPAVAWFVAREPEAQFGEAFWTLDTFAVQPQVGIWSLAEVAARLPPAPPPEVVPPVEMGVVCEAPPALGPEIDVAENWKIVPEWYAAERVQFANGILYVNAPSAAPAVIVCAKDRLLVRNRARVKARWKLEGVSATGGIGAVLTARFFGEDGKLTGMNHLAGGRGDSDWKELDTWLGAPEGSERVVVCVEALSDHGTIVVDNLHLAAVE